MSAVAEATPPVVPPRGRMMVAADDDDGVAKAIETLRAAMNRDPAYAWSWHCNIAMAYRDSTGISHLDANVGAHCFLRRLFGVETREPGTNRIVPGLPDSRQPQSVPFRQYG